jgi:hypothetical protein
MTPLQAENNRRKNAVICVMATMIAAITSRESLAFNCEGIAHDFTVVDIDLEAGLTPLQVLVAIEAAITL